MKKIIYTQYLDKNALKTFARESYLEGFFHDNPFRPFDYTLTPMNYKTKIRYYERCGKDKNWVELDFDAYSIKYVTDNNKSIDSKSAKARFNREITKQWRAHLYRTLKQQSEELAESYCNSLLHDAKTRKFASNEEKEKYIEETIETLEAAKSDKSIYSI